MAVLLVTGPPGAGKTAYSVRAIGRALAAGTPVATNVRLRPDFAEYTAKHTAGISRAKRRRRAAEIRELVHVGKDMQELARVRLRPGKAKTGFGEGRGLMVLDEAGTWLNSRSWSTGDRGDIIEWFATHRHHGWDVLLIAQDEEMIDKQVRHLMEQHIQLRNARGFKRFGIPVIPFRIFIALWTWHATGGRLVTKREVYRLGWWKRLYDTHERGRIDADQPDDPDCIYLPARRPASVLDPESPDDDHQEHEDRDDGHMSSTRCECGKLATESGACADCEASCRGALMEYSRDDDPNGIVPLSSYDDPDELAATLPP